MPGETIRLRDAVAGDMGRVLALIRELAAFEREPDAVVATEADLVRDGFGPDRVFRCRLAEQGGEVVGFTLWFFNYSTWLGRRGIYLEDFYVAEAARGRGVGELLIRDLAGIAVSLGAQRLDLSVLEWNPARGFYEKMGIRRHEGWLPYRIAGEAIRVLAEG